MIPIDENYNKLLHIYADAMKISVEEHERNIIESRVNRLLEALYGPKGTEFVLDSERMAHLCVDEKEPVNWGSLNCSEVKRLPSGNFIILIEEASPDGCPSLCEYIQEHLEACGWLIDEVKTEW